MQMGFLIIGEKDGEYVYQEFSGFTEKRTLEGSIDYVLKNGVFLEGSGFPWSQFPFNQSEFSNLSIINQKNLSLDEFKGELLNDSEFKELHNFARELGYLYPLIVKKSFYGDKSSITIVILISNIGQYTVKNSAQLRIGRNYIEVTKKGD